MWTVFNLICISMNKINGENVEHAMGIFQKLGKCTAWLALIFWGKTLHCLLGRENGPWVLIKFRKVCLILQIEKKKSAKEGACKLPPL